MIKQLAKHVGFNIRPIALTYHIIAQKVHIKVNEGYKLHINNLDIGHPLEFHTNKVISSDTAEFSQDKVPVNSYQKVYVYTDIMGNQSVRDAKTT